MPKLDGLDLSSQAARERRRRCRAAAQPSFTAQELNEFVSTYYQLDEAGISPAQKRSRTIAALRYVLSGERDVSELHSYFFARIAQGQPELIRAYEGELPRLPEHGTRILLNLLEEVGDDQTRSFLERCARCDDCHEQEAAIREKLADYVPGFQSAMLRAVRSPIDLDLLWTEFLVTGDKAAVVKIIEVLDWPDLTRLRLGEWLNAARSRTWSERRIGRRMRRLEEAVGIRYLAGEGRIANREDLDTLCFMNGVFMSQERFRRVRRLLPFSLQAEELNHVAVKLAAKWSLASNALQHAPVLEACAEQAREGSLALRLSMLEILAEVEMANVFTAHSSLVYLNEYLELNPENRYVAQRRDEVDRYGVSSPPERPQRPRIASVNGSGGAVVVVTAWFLVFGRFREGFYWFAGEHPAGAAASAVVCFLLAVALGGVRQMFKSMLSRAFPVQTDQGTVLLGDVPNRFWSSPATGTVTWALVAVWSAWASGIGAALAIPDRTPASGFPLAFSALVLGRWVLSAVASRLMRP